MMKVLILLSEAHSLIMAVQSDMTVFKTRLMTDTTRRQSEAGRDRERGRGAKKEARRYSKSV